MSKGILGFVCGAAAGAALVLAYLHKDVITAAIKGEELPKAPEGCPFSKCEPDDEPEIELELEPDSI